MNMCEMHVNVGLTSNSTALSSRVVSFRLSRRKLMIYEKKTRKSSGIKRARRINRSSGYFKKYRGISVGPQRMENTPTTFKRGERILDTVPLDKPSLSAVNADFLTTALSVFLSVDAAAVPVEARFVLKTKFRSSTLLSSR